MAKDMKPNPALVPAIAALEAAGFKVVEANINTFVFEGDIVLKYKEGRVASSLARKAV
jgi:hypothetical protein